MMTEMTAGPAWSTGGGCRRCAETVRDPWNLGCPHGGHERAGESPLNLELLDRVLDAIRGARKLVETAEGDSVLTAGNAGPAWDQDSWRESLVAVVRDDWFSDVTIEGEKPRCGTAMCVAGWTAHLDGLPGERVWLIPDEVIGTRTDLDGLSLLVAREDDDDDYVDPEGGEEADGLPGLAPVTTGTIEVMIRAERLLGLDRARDLLDEGPWNWAELRPMRDGEWHTALVELFSGGNTLERIERYRAALGDANAWLMERRDRWPSADADT